MEPAAPRSPWAVLAPSDHGLLVGAILCVVAAAVLLGTWDLQLSASVRAWEAPAARGLLTGATRLGDWRVEAVLLILVAAAGGVFRRPRLRGVGIAALAALLVAGLLTEAVKHTSCRGRPLSTEAGTFQPPFCFEAGIDSFPSGHTSQAFAIAVVSTAAYPHLAVSFYGLAAAIALSRVVLGAHYASDVLAGAALGLLIGALCRRQFRRLAAGEAVSDLAASSPPGGRAPLPHA